MMIKQQKIEWWQTIFNEKYLKTYVDVLNPEVTNQQVAFLIKKLKLKKGAEILDLACGHGRHAIELTRRGYDVTGLDYSKHFINIARETAKKFKIDVKFVQDDMRQLSYEKKFDAVINMFTSFGYFDNENDNIIVLRKIARALKPGGKFLIDLNNAVRTIIHIVKKGKEDKKTGNFIEPSKDYLSNGLVVTTKNEWNPVAMQWSMTRSWKEKGKLMSYRTNVRLFVFPELKHLLEENGLKVKNVWGDFEGSTFKFDSRRLIILAIKEK